MQLKDEDGGTTLEDWDEGDDSSEPISDPTIIWNQHALHIQRRYRRVGLPDFAVETRLAFQKKIFDLHVDREHQLRKATESSPNFDTDAQYPIHEGTSTSWNTVLATATFSKHSLWELTCPMFWRHFEGGRSFDHPQWAPRGLMRIQTVSNSVRVRSVRIGSLSRRLSTLGHWCFLPSATRRGQTFTLSLRFLLGISLRFDSQ